MTPEFLLTKPSGTFSRPKHVYMCSKIKEGRIGGGTRPFLLDAILKAAPGMYMMMTSVLKKGGGELSVQPAFYNFNEKSGMF